jgi:beta-lactamase regulating signal transducer with metallopeptidase domain
MTQTIVIEEHTHRRLFTILHELTHFKKRDLTIDDVINELIDTYQESSWTNFGAGTGGG